MGFWVFSTIFVLSDLIEITEDFIRVGGCSKNLTVITVRYRNTCYKQNQNNRHKQKEMGF